MRSVLNDNFLKAVAHRSNVGGMLDSGDERIYVGYCIESYAFRESLA